MKRITALLAVLLISPHFLFSAEPAAPPNIIYIMADDLGYGDLGCFGQKEIQTPNLDKLASEGMRLTSFYAGCTVCRPSRLSLWTGNHMGHTPISSNASYAFKPEDLTVAELLQKAGYKTGGVGKWAMGGVETSGHPNKNGFDFWMGYLDQGEAHNYYPTHLWRNMEKFPLPGNELMEHPSARGRVSSKRMTYAHDVMIDQAFEFIRDNHKSPFLFHFHLTIPHANNEGGRVTGDGMEVPDYGIYKKKPWPNTAKGQAAMITRMDSEIGRLMELLRELKIDDNTLVIFTSDNGPHSEGGHQHEYFNANGPLRGYKRDLYEGGIRVPTIAWWPGNIARGSKSDEPLAFYDFLPTACELAGVKAPKNINGISFLATLTGSSQHEHDYLFWKYQEKLAVRKGKWKGVIPGKGKPLELYDLSADIGETKNLAAEKKDLVQYLTQCIEEATESSPSK
jgi:uncharacterized sulfatase